MGLFGKTPTPEERKVRSSPTQVREWQSKLRAEGRQLDRAIRSTEQEMVKTKMSIKQLAKKGDMKSAQILAKELVKARKSVDRLHTSKAQLNSVALQLTNQLAVIRVSGSIQKSSEIMRGINALVKVPDISRAMMQLGQEMTKAGLIEEMLDDAMDAMDADDLEEEADEEVEKVLAEITSGILASNNVPIGKGKERASAAEEEDLEADRALAERYAL